MANEFDGTVKVKHMTPLVAVAMMQQCDHDLTKVHFFATRLGFNHGHPMRTQVGVTMSRCLRCAFTSITGYRMQDVPEDWVERLMDPLLDGRFVITGIALYEDGEECPTCRRIP